MSTFGITAYEVKITTEEGTETFLVSAESVPDAEEMALQEFEEEWGDHHRFVEFFMDTEREI